MHDTYDLLMDIIGLDVTESVLSDILSALPEQSWCSRDFFALSLNEALSTSWSAFSETVKYETRYLFTLPSNAEEAESVAVEGEDQGRWDATPVDIYPATPSSDLDGEIDYDRQHGIPPYEMLDAIGKLVRRLRIFRAVPTGTVLYRARVHDANERFTTAAELGPPGREDARQPNRMSPAGIVMFYGALDRDTAISETFQANRQGASQKVVSVAQFETMSETLVLDLTALPPVPSIFDRTERQARHGIAFLHEFVEDLTQPIARDGTEHIEYVPTQIATEYFRRRFLTDEGRQLQGIIYQSSQREAGIACVLFIDAYTCGVPSPSGCDPEQRLRLLEDRVERIPGQVLVDLETRHRRSGLGRAAVPSGWGVQEGALGRCRLEAAGTSKRASFRVAPGRQETQGNPCVPAVRGRRHETEELREFGATRYSSAAWFVTIRGGRLPLQRRWKDTFPLA